MVWELSEVLYRKDTLSTISKGDVVPMQMVYGSSRQRVIFLQSLQPLDLAQSVQVFCNSYVQV